MKTIIIALFLLITGTSFAQTFTFQTGDYGPALPAMVDPTSYTFENYGNRYVMLQSYSMKEGTLLQLHGFTAANGFQCSKVVKVPEDKMQISLYAGFLNLDNNLQLVKTTFVKDAQKTMVSAHAIDAKGVVNPEKKEICSITAEKVMNQGNFSCATSPDRRFGVILSEMPFVKETKEKIMITVVDQNLKTVYSKEFELPYDAKRGPVNTPVIANDGSVYIIKKAMVSKMPDVLTVFAVTPDGSSFKEVAVKLDDPKKYESHGYTINEKNQLVVSGFYTEDGKVSFGGTKQKGTFYMIVNAKGETITYQTSAFEKPFTYLSIRQVLVKPDGKACVITEVYSKKTNSTMGEGNQVTYNTEINRDNVHVFFLNEKGEFLKEVEFVKGHKSIDDGGLFGSVFGTVYKDKLVLTYNDSYYKHDGKKYVVVPPTIAWIRIPVIQVMDFNGTLEKTVPFLDSPVGGKKDEANMLPLTGITLSEGKIFIMASNKADFRPIILTIQ